MEGDPCRNEGWPTLDLMDFNICVACYCPAVNSCKNGRCHCRIDEKYDTYISGKIKVIFKNVLYLPRKVYQVYCALMWAILIFSV